MGLSGPLVRTKGIVMTNPPRRKRFQVHLSTAVVLMFAAGGIIWGNLCAYEESVGPSMEMQPGDMCRFYGWPARAFTLNITQGFSHYDAFAATIDVVTALAILFAVWFVCERWIAWRAGRKKG